MTTASVWAAPIFVSNPSFEVSPPGGLPNLCGTACSFSVDTIPGWRNVPFLGLGLSSGQFSPGAQAGDTTYFSSISDGPLSAFTTTGCIEQTVAASVQPGVTYTLQVDVGWRKDAAPAGLGRIRVNGVFYDAVGTALRGGWAPFTATYVGRPEDAGLPITICLSSVTLQGNFDNVRFSDSTSPAGVDPSPNQAGLRLAAAPNPFRSGTVARFALAQASRVSLRVMDIAGRSVRTLLGGATLEPGLHQATWDGRDDAGAPVRSGLYFLRLDTGGTREVQQLLRLR